MKQVGQILVLTILVALCSSAVVGAVNYQEKQDAINALTANYPGTQFYIDGSAVTRIYGQAFGSGSTPQEAAESFRLAYAPALGVASDELRAESRVISDGNVQPVMYLPESGKFKFMLVYYNQYKDDIPVYDSELRILVQNQPGYPVVWAGSSLKDLGDFQVGQMQAAVNPQTLQKAFLSVNPQYTRYTEARKVVWAGNGKLKSEPKVAVEFVADDGNTPTTNKFRFMIDATTGEIIYQQDLVIDVNVTGQVNGNATENFKSEQCGNEISTHLPYARVYINSGSPFYADTLGNYTITNSGSTPVTVTSYIRGRYFQVFNQAGSESYLTQSVTPPGPANFLHNPSNTEYVRAEVNGYLHANKVRDYTLKYNPSYPTISTQYDWPVYVNDNTGYCPGNAWYDGSSITFCRASSPYPNTAFSTVIHHEYGHHLVAMAGSGQDEYGEGMGDVMGLLITDNPGAAWGFYGSCSQALRNADNSIQYPCVGEIHDCGQLISGCVWSIRNALIVSYPSTYRDILSDLAINAMLMHTGGGIAPDIAVDYLTLDDDDGNINNGTPHYSEICTGFNAHNMDCPVLTLLTFSYPNGRPSYISPSGGTTMRVNVTGVGGTPQQNSGVLHYNSGSSWQTVNMTQVSANVYDAVFPAITCGTSVNYYVSARTTTNVTINDPSNAPSSYYTVLSAAELTTVFSDNFATNTGWTGTGSSGEWTIGVATGGAGDDSYGSADPAADHSSTTDNKLLGNDLTSGDGDYEANLGSTYYVTSPTINCTGLTSITLSFWRWLGVEQNAYDNASLQAYNGSSWVTLFSNGSTTIDETAWTQSSYDVSAYANNNANFKIRFGIGSADGSWQYCGWNIDDVLVTAISCASSNGTIAGTVTDSRGNVANCILHAFDSSSHNAYDTTLTGGAYSMSVPSGTYSLTLTQVDHRDTTLTGIPVTVGNTTTRNVVMQRLKGAIRGTVTSGPSQPISGVRVIANGSGREDTTGTNGVYLISNLVDGTFTITFDASAGYRDSIINNISITPGDTTALNVVLTEIQGGCTYIIGDANGNGTTNGIDVTYMVNFLKGVGAEPPNTCDCPGHGFIYSAADANGSCDFNGIDVTYMVNYLKGGAIELLGCPDCPPTMAKGRNSVSQSPDNK
jgi:hypothetical protein